MARDHLDTEIEGQITFDDIYNPPQRLVAISNILYRAREKMTVAEEKTFVYALTQVEFTKEAKSNYVRLDKKTLANILGIHSDADHLSVDLFDNIKGMPGHSYLEIVDKDRDLYSSGFLVGSITSFKNMVRIRFNDEYMSLFTGLTRDYMTLWSTDVFQMKSKRSIQFYEYLRANVDPNSSSTSATLGIKFLKELFEIPKDGSGSYMSKEGHFLRTHFEKKVIDPLCEDLKNCRMIQLTLQPNGKYYEKVKEGKRVSGYRFTWVYSKYPRVATSKEVKEIQERVDKNPQVLKVAKDILNGEKKPKTESKKKNAWDFGEKMPDGYYEQATIEIMKRQAEAFKREEEEKKKAQAEKEIPEMPHTKEEYEETVKGSVQTEIPKEVLDSGFIREENADQMTIKDNPTDADLERLDQEIAQQKRINAYMEKLAELNKLKSENK